MYDEQMINTQQMNPTSHTLRVLVVEDHLDIAENIGDYLTLQGHIVDFAMDGISGMHLALTQEFDVIILDLMLPGMDGLTLCRKLREEADKQTPVLMLTARDTLDDKLTGFDSGADDYLVKPFALEELYARILALAKRRAAPSQAALAVADLKMDLGTWNTLPHQASPAKRVPVSGSVLTSSTASASSSAGS